MLAGPAIGGVPAGAPFSYYDASSPAKQKQINKLIKILTDLITKPQKYPYINHYKANQQDVPLWALVNALSFGTISKFYELSKPQIQSAISRDFSSINESQLRKLLEVLTDFRNVCAHEEKLLDMMGMPANWKRVTAYKKD